MTGWWQRIGLVWMWGFMGEGWRKGAAEGRGERQRWKELVMWRHTTLFLCLIFPSILYSWQERLHKCVTSDMLNSKRTKYLRLSCACVCVCVCARVCVCTCSKRLNVCCCVTARSRRVSCSLSESLHLILSLLLFFFFFFYLLPLTTRWPLLSRCGSHFQ